MHLSSLALSITRCAAAGTLALALAWAPMTTLSTPAQAATTAATQVTPKGPTFNETAKSVYIPSDQGVRYYITVDGANITKEGLPYAKPGTYTEADGLKAGVPITVTAKSAGSSTVLVLSLIHI